MPADTGAQGAWGVSIDKHGTVFVSTYGTGHVYRLPWRGQLEDLGRPSPRTSFTWEGDTDDRGIFYFGTSEFFGTAPLPGGKLFSWDPKTRQYRDYGDWGASFGYVRSVEYAKGKLYAGLGPNVGLWQVDPRTGKRVEIPAPAGMPTDKYAYQMEDEGGYLYVLFAGGTTASVGWTLDLRTLKQARGGGHPAVSEHRGGHQRRRSVLGEVDHAVAELGASRVLFGSDAPIRDPATALSKVLGSGLSERDRRLVLSENASRVYGRLS